MALQKATDVYGASGKIAFLTSGYNDGGSKIMYIKSKAVSISGTSITNVSGGSLEVTIDNTNIANHENVNHIYITRVDGYK